MPRYEKQKLDRINGLLDTVVLGADRPHTVRPLPSDDGEYLWGPVSLSWLVRAVRLPGKACVVAMALLFLRGHIGFAEVALRATLVRRFGLSRQSAYRAIRHLESAGLISVTHRRGRAPLVRFHDL